MVGVDLSRCEPFYTRNKKSCSIRPFCEKDVDRILSIETQASPYPWSRKNFFDSLSSSHICVGVECDEAWLAHAVFSIAAEDSELLILAVAPEYQGQKIATQFLTQMERIIANHARQLFLEVRESNESAIKLYESLGFHRLGERLNYYPRPDKRSREHALIYGKYIGE